MCKLKNSGGTTMNLSLLMTSHRQGQVIVLLLVNIIGVLSCDEGWVFYATTNSCFHLYKSRVDWGSANKWCSSVDAMMATMYDHDEQLFIYNTVIKPFGGAAWLGASDLDRERTWKWVDGKVMDIHRFKWKEGNPDDASSIFSSEDCLTMTYAGLLNDYKCRRELPYLCQKAYIPPPTSSTTSSSTNSTESHTSGDENTKVSSTIAAAVTVCVLTVIIAVIVVLVVIYRSRRSRSPAVYEDTCRNDGDALENEYSALDTMGSFRGQHPDQPRDEQDGKAGNEAYYADLDDYVCMSNPGRKDLGAKQGERHNASDTVLAVQGQSKRGQDQPNQGPSFVSASKLKKGGKNHDARTESQTQKEQNLDSGANSIDTESPLTESGYVNVDIEVKCREFELSPTTAPRPVGIKTRKGDVTASGYVKVDGEKPKRYVRSDGQPPTRNPVIAGPSSESVGASIRTRMRNFLKNVEKTDRARQNANKPDSGYIKTDDLSRDKVFERDRLGKTQISKISTDSTSVGYDRVDNLLYGFRGNPVKDMKPNKDSHGYLVLT